MTDDDGPPGDRSLEESTRQHNSNLQSLIEAIGGILAASGELLAHLQQILSRRPPPDDEGSPPSGGSSPPGDA